MGKKNQWSGGLAFVIASVASAVGLGNLWKFPYITYEYGGGAFVIVYLIALAVVGLPVLIAEMYLGKVTGKGIVEAFSELSGKNSLWRFGGYAGVLAAFMVLSYYTIVCGWTLGYLEMAATGKLSNLSPENSGEIFGNFLKNGPKQVLYHTIFSVLTAFIVVKGVSGIEKATKVLMPILACMIIGISTLTLSEFGASTTLSFLFNPNFESLSGGAILEAVGHAFFTLGVGTGIMAIYGAYLPKKTNIVKSALLVCALDTVVALLACFMIFPILFGTGMEVSASTSLLFTTISAKLIALPYGESVIAVFYLLVAFAGLSSTVSILEVGVAFVEKNFGIGRTKSTVLACGIIWFFGAIQALGLGYNEFISSLGVMEKFDFTVSNILLPLSGFLIAIFVGWFASSKQEQDEIEGEGNPHFAFKHWKFVLKYISPVLIGIVIIDLIIG